MTEDKTVRWHHQLNGHESEQALGDSERQESLLCCSPWGCKESDKTEPLNKCKMKICDTFLKNFKVKRTDH